MVMTSIHQLQQGPVKTVLKDLSLSVEWHDLRSLVLPGTEWTIILGHKRRQDPLRAVLALPLHTTSLKPSALKSIFSSLSTLDTKDIPEHIPPYVPSIHELREKMGRPMPHDEEEEENEGEDERSHVINEEIDREMIYIAIMASDSTIVYYRLTRGIKKPADIPDE